jgi:hypothetical protein
VLGNALRAAVRAMYADAEQTAIYPRWCGRMTLPDYRQFHMITVSEVPDLLLRPEGQDVKFATFTDAQEIIQLFMFSRGMRFTQQAQRNDLFGVFARQIRNFAGAAVRLMDRMTTAILTANAAMGDTGALFNATAQTTAGGHNNLLNPQVVLSVSSSANWAASMAALAAGRVSLATRLGLRTAEDGDNGPAVLNIQPKWLMTAAAIVDTATVILGSGENTLAGLGVVNAVKNMVPTGNVFGNPYLDIAGATNAWYLGGDPNGTGGGVQAGFLQGEEVPETRTEINFRTGDLEVICEHKAGAKADDSRGLFCGHV